MMKGSGTTKKKAPDQPSDYCSIRDLLLDKPPTELRHELPKLIETVSEAGVEGEGHSQFVIGVSFTTNGTCFDYWIDQVKREAGVSEYQVEERKQAISSNHSYVTFVYPSDPHFDASTLRGCLVSTVEERLEIEPQVEPERQGWLARCISLIRG